MMTAVDVLRVLLTLVAGGTMLQLIILTWQDYRTGRRWCVPLQATVVVALLHTATSASLRIGQPLELHPLVGHVAIVVMATCYTLARQGLVPPCTTMRRP